MKKSTTNEIRSISFKLCKIQTFKRRKDFITLTFGHLRPNVCANCD